MRRSGVPLRDDVTPSCLAPTVLGTNIVLTNDDGWAVAMIRAQYEALNGADHNVGPLFLQSHLLTSTQSGHIRTRRQ